MPALNPLQQFANHFENLTDPRMERTRRHILQDILVIALCAMIANSDTWVDIENYGKAKLDFLRRYLELPNGNPSHDTFSFLLLTFYATCGEVFGVMRQLVQASFADRAARLG